jgi:uncharacterized membrane protein
MMTLPVISIPEIPLPIQIPELLHPAIVHFVITIPIVVLLLELYNLGVKRRSISVFSLIMLIVVALVMFGAYLTGGIDGHAAIDAGLSSEGIKELKEHKLLGTYLVYASLGLLLFKILFMAIGKTFGKVLFILILGGFIAVTLNQGKEGGELVYKFGSNNEAIVDIKSELDDTVEEKDELQEKVDEFKEKISLLEESAKKAKEEIKTEPVTVNEETNTSKVESVEQPKVESVVKPVDENKTETNSSTVASKE